ncbi:unnamed protein product [Clavelina lepadiformis]|uniref:Cyclin-like domain-containing protein n=2 Tax=Clavelina lepadiformis TaxID=159417 RepID=A0ABP0FDU7_CLALP
MFHTFKKFPRYVTATCCLFLAGKVEETPKKCKDLIKVARSLLNEGQFAQFGDDPKEEVLTFEKVLLQTIKFDLTVEHPYKYMLQYAKALKGERSKIEKLVQMAWTFINDSLCTSLCLQWEPQIVAVAVMYLAGRLCKFEPQDWAYNRGRWWEQFIDDISMDLLEDICHQVLDQYSQQKGNKGTVSSKVKRERPKTPGDVDKSAEPQAKSSRSEIHKPTTKTAAKKQHLSRTPAVNSKNAQFAQRRTSSNTDVVAMDTVDITDRGAIEQGNDPYQSNKTANHSTSVTSFSQTPTRSTHSDEHSTYYHTINQYLSFMGSADSTSLGFMQPGQYSQGFLSQSSGLSTLPGVIQTASAQLNFPSNSNSVQQNVPTFPPSFDSNVSAPIDSNYNVNRFPRTPTAKLSSFQQNQSSFQSQAHGRPAGQASTSLATVRITNRRDKQAGSQWS